MKRRIVLYNTITVIAALVVLLAVSGLAIHGVTSFYRERFASGMDDAITQVQSILDAWEIVPGTWAELDEQLQALGYSLYAARNDTELYSSLNDLQTALLERGSALSDWPEGGAVSVWSEGVCVVGLRSGAYTVLSMGPVNMPEMFGRPRLQTEAILLVVLVVGVTVIAVIAALSVLSARLQTRQIMQPVRALTQAARRIEQGDYSQPVESPGQDEFAAVYSAFEHMRRHLNDEREKNRAYEQGRTDLVRGISHDLRTPLTSVQGYLKGLRDGVANTPEKQARYLDVAYRKACEMDILLRRLFAFSEMETGKLPLFPEPVDLGEFVRAFARDAAEELEPHGGRVVLRGAPAPHPVRIDKAQMRRVLSNLMNNAVRYAQTEPLVLTLTVWRERDRERLRFADNGTGVDEADLPRLFEQFWRGDRSRAGGDGEGSGLGLYIVKYIVEAHGGSVSARNDNGLTVELALPSEEG